MRKPCHGNPIDPSVFDRQSDYWLSKQGLPNGLLEVVEPFLDRGLTALDIGCGGGRLAAALGSRFERMTGLDRAGELLRRAATTWPVVRFVEGDCLDPSVWQRLGGPFDLIVSNCSIRRDYTPDLPHLAALCHANLAPAGGIGLRIQAEGDLKGILPQEIGHRLLYDLGAIEGAFRVFDDLRIVRETYRQRFSSRSYLLAFLERIGLPGDGVVCPRSGAVTVERAAWIVAGRRGQHGTQRMLSVP